MPNRDLHQDQDERPALKRKRRGATVYDAVAGRIGLNGFLTPEQREMSSAQPLAPEDVLLKSSAGPNPLLDQYKAEERLENPDKDLPESDLLKAAHAYASDFYSKATPDCGKQDFRSLDGSALIAIGCLLEEAARQALGDNGDMALVEPAGLAYGLPQSRLTRHQVVGKVKPPPTPEQGSEASETDTDDEPARKRRG